MLEELLERFRRRDRAALARLLTLAARGEALAEIAAGLPTPSQAVRLVAVTGSPGVGKSTLIGQLIQYLRRRGVSVAVLACDPQSPLSGGALLGDRVRMSAATDDGVFIRSLATPGERGAVVERLDLLLRVVAAFGFEVVLVETVGAGQGDTAVRALVDVVVLLLQPESGDDLQWEKAGLLEVADVIVVHKADLPGAEQTAAQVRTSLGLGNSPAIPVVLVSSKEQRGIDALWQAVAAAQARHDSQPDTRLLRQLHDELTRRFHAAQAGASSAWGQIVADARRGDASAVVRALRHLAGS